MNPEGEIIYEHFLRACEWLGTAEALSAATAMRSLHVIAGLLPRWQLSLTPLCSQGENTPNHNEVDQSELLERSRWVLDSSVGDLLRLQRWARGFNEIPPKAPSLPDQFTYVVLPSPGELFHTRSISPAWATHFDHLKREFRQLDLIMLTLPTNYYDLRAILFHGYLLASTLHQSLSLIEYASTMRLG